LNKKKPAAAEVNNGPLNGRMLTAITPAARSFSGQLITLNYDDTQTSTVSAAEVTH